MKGWAGLAIGVLHAGAVVGLLSATAPAWRPATGERSPLGVWLIPTPAVTAERVPTGPHGLANNGPCARTFEIDELGRLYDIGPPSRAFLRSLPAGSDGHFPRIGILCRPWPGAPAWSKREPRPSRDQGGWMPPVIPGEITVL